ncbi:efflux transporter periplasmic adaptor subunit [Tamilnaduibacter salinus]|uniref:Efflux transporter periplasmic adaptor subunit n=1 Tax=Tamilnaduibacter salinus TaxID=1484056 RepID=A0A2A2I684_9GAMM|nr:HlyD family secretion protein [Tamilnaduibacter salinus]PAV27249.1 efflux transporter periplasmic adaptor subunit [Tamilnaduibacter salinus]
MGKLLRIGITLSVLAVAILAGTWVWHHYLYSPWTRDGRIQADVVTVTPDVSGWVTNLAVTHHESVDKGDLLFTVDDTRYQAALTEARAQLARQKSALELARHQYQRRKALSGERAISEEDLETYRIQMQSAKADHDLAKARLKEARIDLERTQIRAPADGTISNLSLREGNYATRGQPALSLIQDGSFYVTGYFEETKIQRIHPGQKATMTLMGSDQTLTGTVTGIARGIADANTQGNDQLLPEVQQVFNWVRLAQRIPVEVALDPVPDELNLSAGMTVSIRLKAE